MSAKLSIIAAQGGAAKFAVVDDNGTVVEFEFTTAAEAIAAHNALARAKITAPQRHWTRNADRH
ncbi:MAG TPA: hypothetical protein VFI48_09545 [Hyphomicrobiaceae bacterium]|jgi:hypothetical protein|nr:hypothetical protein [Hyphomicrobiaceae bacterium]